ncbi:MAG: hypothetical protein LBM98_09890 [Oscillospiraceae bacterium]|nr:hypothetical protein [Oscillospiraceae bacterium]
MDGVTSAHGAGRAGLKPAPTKRRNPATLVCAPSKTPLFRERTCLRRGGGCRAHVQTIVSDI